MVWDSINPMKDTKDYLTDVEFNIILALVRKEEHRVLLKLLYKTGRRVSEITGDKITNSPGLKVQDIDFQKGLINFIILKKKPIKVHELTKEQRLSIRRKMTPFRSLLPVKREVLDMLKEFCKDKEGKVFNVTRFTISRVFKKAAQDAGIDKRVHVHMLRHSFAIRQAELATNPADIEKLRQLLGHSNINVTQAYLKFNPEDIREMVERA